MKNIHWRDKKRLRVCPLANNGERESEQPAQVVGFLLAGVYQTRIFSFNNLKALVSSARLH